MEGMDVMSAMAQALPLHKLQCSNGEEAYRFQLGVYYNDAEVPHCTRYLPHGS